MITRARAAVLTAILPLLCGCNGMRGSHGGGQAVYRSEQRPVRPKDVAVPLGYSIEPVATGLTFPTAVLFDDRERVYVVESGYSRGDSWAVPRLLRLEPHDEWTVIAQGDRNGPWSGAVFHKGYFYVSEGGVLEGGRILRIDPDTGRATPMVADLPSRGDHQTGAPAIGPDGYLYFGQGTMTNAGVVGDDSQRGWRQRFPDAHDVPCADVTLSGRNYLTLRGQTGAFLPAGKASTPNQVVRGEVPCSGAVLRLPLEGESKPELVAWGFRDPGGLAFSPKGRLFVTDRGYAERGSRPVWGAADMLWAVSTGTWYGWPDYSGDRPVTDSEFKPPRGPAPGALLASAPGKPPRPTALFGVHSAAGGVDFSRSESFGHVGEAFVAQFGDSAPLDGGVAGPVGFKVVRVDTDSGLIEDFAVNKGRTNGPASLLGSGGLERPVSVRFSPDGGALYVVDFGVMTADDENVQPRKQTGVLWKITREH